MTKGCLREFDKITHFHTIKSHSGLSRDPVRRAFLLVEIPESGFYAFEVFIIECSKFGPQSAVIDRARLLQARVHRFRLMTDRHIPAALSVLRRCGNDEVEPVRKLLKNDGWARELLTLAVDLRAYILADATPPNVPLRNKRRLMGFLMQLGFEAQPLQKRLHTSRV